MTPPADCSRRLHQSVQTGTAAISLDWQSRTSAVQDICPTITRQNPAIHVPLPGGWTQRTGVAAMESVDVVVEELTDEPLEAGARCRPGCLASEGLDDTDD